MVPHRNYEIEQEADSYFRSKLNNRWLKRAQLPDFHVDYIVEMDENGAPSGEKFAVQLKGTRSPRYIDAELTFRLKVGHLKYYVDRSPEPVFLVVIDLSNGRGYWLFLQRYEKESMEEWRDQKSVTIHFPAQNVLGDVEALREAATNAVDYMRNIRPGSVGAAVGHLKGRLENLDDRFVADVSYTTGVTRINLQPKHVVDGAVKFRDAQSRRKLNEALATGRPIYFEPGEIKLIGSPIFAEILKLSSDEGLSFQAAKTVKCTCSIFGLEPSGEEVPIIPTMSGSIVAGNSEAHIKATLGHGMLKLSSEIRFTGTATIRDQSFRMSFEYDKWEEKELLLAPHFDRINALMEAIVRRMPLGLICEIDGNVLFKSSIKIDDITPFASGPAAYMELLERARLVARHIGAVPRIPPLATVVSEQGNIEFLWLLCAEGPLAENIADGQGKLVVPNAADAQDAFVQPLPDNHPGVCIRVEETAPSLFDTPLHEWVIIRRITRLVLTEDAAVRLKTGIRDGVGEMELDVQCSPTSVCYTSLERQGIT